MENKVFRCPARWIFYILRDIYEKGLLKKNTLIRSYNENMQDAMGLGKIEMRQQLLGQLRADEQIVNGKSEKIFIRY